MKKLEEMLGGDAEGFATSTRVDPFELSAFSGLNGGFGGVVMTAAGRVLTVADRQSQPIKHPKFSLLSRHSR